MYCKYDGYFQERSYAIFSSLMTFYSPLATIVSIYVALYRMGKMRVRAKMAKVEKMEAIMRSSEAENKKISSENAAPTPAFDIKVVNYFLNNPIKVVMK